MCVNVATTFIVYLEGYVTGKCRLYAHVSTHVVERLYGVNTDSVCSRVTDSNGKGYNFVGLPCTNSRTHNATFLMYRQTDRQADSQTDRQAGRQTERETDRQTDRQRETDRQTDRQL
jgi:hypothetical protein